MGPLFPFLLGAAATALLTTDSGRRLADRVGEAAKTYARGKYDEAMDALKTLEGAEKDAENSPKEAEHERNA